MPGTGGTFSPIIKMIITGGIKIIGLILKFASITVVSLFIASGSPALASNVVLIMPYMMSAIKNEGMVVFNICLT